MSYDSVVLADGPALYWDLEESGTTNTVADASGNGRTGKRYQNQSVGAGTGITNGWAPLSQDESLPGDHSNLINGNWTSGSQQYPGTGIRADSYVPYAQGSQRTFECLIQKIEGASFATLFSSKGSGSGSPSAGNSPEPTWEMGYDRANGRSTMRYYPNVGQTFPLGWYDWGTHNTRHPASSFQLQVPQHIVCQWDDAAKVAEWFVNGHSMGRQAGPGYGKAQGSYAASPGVFQVGWRGNYDTPNTEVLGAFIDKIAVYERLLTRAEIMEHAREAVLDGIVPSYEEVTAVVRERSRGVRVKGPRKNDAIVVPDTGTVIANPDNAPPPPPEDPAYTWIKQDPMTASDPIPLWKGIGADRVDGDEYATSTALSEVSAGRFTRFSSGGPANGPFYRLKCFDGDRHWGERMELANNSKTNTFYTYSINEWSVTDFYIRLSPDFPIDTTTWQIVCQIKHAQAHPATTTNDSPPLAVEVNNGRWNLKADGVQIQQGPVAVRNVWTRLQLNVVHSLTGWVQFSVDDWTGAGIYRPTVKKAAATGSGYTINDPIKSHLRIGVYRNDIISGDAYADYAGGLGIRQP